MAGNPAYTDKRYRKQNARMRRSTPTPICWICGELIDLELPRHHRMAWTADHLTPLSQGGDIYGERRPAHRACNSSRGDGTHPTPADKFPTTRNW